VTRLFILTALLLAGCPSPHDTIKATDDDGDSIRGNRIVVECVASLLREPHVAVTPNASAIVIECAKPGRGDGGSR
jgi:hypothetical protein